MKCTFTTLFFVFCLPSLWCQSSQVYLSYAHIITEGYTYLGDTTYRVEDPHNVKILNAHAVDLISSSGDISLGLDMNFKHHKLGISGHFEKKIVTSFFADLIIRESKYYNYQVGLNYNYNWLRIKNFKIYSGASLRGGIQHINTLFFNLHRDGFRDLFRVEEGYELEDFQRLKSTDFLHTFTVDLLEIQVGSEYGIAGKFGYYSWPKMGAGDFYYGIKLFYQLKNKAKIESPSK